MGRPRQRAQARHQYNRTDRISETVREVVATELERLGDPYVDGQSRRVQGHGSRLGRRAVVATARRPRPAHYVRGISRSS